MMFDPRQFRHLLIYGAGTAGQQVLAYLTDKGHEVHGFLDRNPTFGQVAGLPVTAAQRWADSYDPAQSCVVIGIFNNNVKMGEVSELLAELGFARVISLPEFVRHYPQDQPDRFWLVDPRFVESHGARIAEMRTGLADQQSRELLDGIVRFRVTGDDRGLPEPTPKQYFPDDLPTWPQPLRFIDCGAYTGDTLLEMQASGLAFEAVAAFEPNLENYRLLAEATKGLQAANFPCGVSDSNKQVGFDGSQGSGGHLSDSGGELVTCLRLDDALPGFAPTLIKMDIEGEEPAALAGAEQLLRTYRPGLAIAVYHRAEQLWTLFEQLRDYQLGYRFYLRSHARNTFEVILYAIP